jgi:hypothetical protein
MSAETVDFVDLGAINDAAVDGERVILQFHLVSGQRDDLLEDRAASARTGSGWQVPARASEVLEFGR